MLRQYRAWLEPDSDSHREEFFARGLIVLDTNVLLSLYEYTPAARDEVLRTLQRVKSRLWLPYQVGLEFVRGRHRVLDSRARTLKAAPNTVNQKLGEAQQAIVAARRLIQDLLMRYGRNDTSAYALDKAISDEAIKKLLTPWRDQLLNHVRELKEHDLKPAMLGHGDVVLQRVAELFGERIAPQPLPEMIRRRVEEAASYRYPNRIPPGFSDTDKDTPLRSAGDYLMWEELIEHAATQDSVSRVLFVSADVKEDWYEPAEPGRGPRPWPMLAEELHLRSGADLRVETPQRFFEGIEKFLGAEIGDSTFQEINSVAEAPTTTQLVADVAAHGRSDLADYLQASGRMLGDVYRTGSSWNLLLRRAGLLEGAMSEEERQLARRIASILHADDPDRVAAYQQLLDDDVPPYDQLDSRTQAYARMLLFNLWPWPEFTTWQAGIELLRSHQAVRQELRVVLSLTQSRRPLGPQLRLGEHELLPLHIHAAYNRAEILAALGLCDLGGMLPGQFAQGAAWCKHLNTDALLVTTSRDYTEANLPFLGDRLDGTQGGDGALSKSLFRWDSQSATAEDSPTGLRYQSSHSHVLLFVRRQMRSAYGGAEPWVLIGPADYVEHEGSKPMRVLWRLNHPLPADVWAYAAKN